MRCVPARHYLSHLLSLYNTHTHTHTHSPPTCNTTLPPGLHPFAQVSNNENENENCALPCYNDEFVFASLMRTFYGLQDAARRADQGRKSREISDVLGSYKGEAADALMQRCILWFCSALLRATSLERDDLPQDAPGGAGRSAAVQPCSSQWLKALFLQLREEKHTHGPFHEPIRCILRSTVGCSGGMERDAAPSAVVKGESTRLLQLRASAEQQTSSPDGLDDCDDFPGEKRRFSSMFEQRSPEQQQRQSSHGETPQTEGSASIYEGESDEDDESDDGELDEIERRHSRRPPLRSSLRRLSYEPGEYDKVVDDDATPRSEFDGAGEGSDGESQYEGEEDERGYDDGSHDDGYDDASYDEDDADYVDSYDGDGRGEEEEGEERERHDEYDDARDESCYSDAAGDRSYISASDAYDDVENVLHNRSVYDSASTRD